MKKKNAEYNNILINNIYKHIVLEAPTAEELEKKVKKYETILVRAITNLYQIHELTLGRDGFYHVTDNGSYQLALHFHFSGINRKNIPYPQQTIKDLEQLTMLESKKHHESPSVISAHLVQARDLKSNEISFETDSLDKLEEAICSKQKQAIEHLLNETRLENISFFPAHREENPDTGKIKVSMKYYYQTRNLSKNLNGHATPEDSGER